MAMVVMQASVISINISRREGPSCQVFWQAKAEKIRQGNRPIYN